MRLGRRRFTDLIERQIDVFTIDNADVLDDVAARLAAYNDADASEAEELYGDYVDAVETGTELLADMRDTFARTLSEEDAEQYEAAFTRAVRKRLPQFALELENR